EDATTKDRLVAEVDADKRLAQGDASAALRRLSGFLAGHPGRSDEQTEAVKAKQAAVREAAEKLADQASARAGAASDPEAKRPTLFEALRGLAETPAADRLKAEIAKATGGAITPTGPKPTALPPGPTTRQPTATPDQVARAAEADKTARERGFGPAKAAYEALAK